MAIIYCINEKLKRRLSVFADVVFFLGIMSPRNEVFQAVPFDGVTSDAKEPLIATGDAEEEDQGLEERDLARLKLGSLLLGLLAGFFFMFAADLGASFLVIYFEMKSNATVIVFSLLTSLFTVVAPLVLLLEFIRNLVTKTFSAVGGSSEFLREDMILQLECHFGMGSLAGICLACILMDVLLGNQVHVVEYPLVTMVVAFIWCKMTMLLASATDGDSKPSSTRSSTTEQTMITV